MTILTEQFGKPLQRTEETPFHKLVPPLERLRSVQFRSHSLYHNLRGLIPAFVLPLVWLFFRWNSSSDLHVIMGETVSVRHLLLAVGIAILWNCWLAFSRYEMRTPVKDLVAEISRLLITSLVCSIFLLIANIGRSPFELGLLFAKWTAFGLVTTSMLLLLSFLVGAAISPYVMRRRAAIIVGTGRRASILRNRLQRQYSPFRLQGCVDDEYLGDDAGRHEYLGNIDELAELLRTHPIQVVLIGLPIKSKYDEIQRVIGICEAVGVEVHYMQDIFMTSLANVEVNKQLPHHFTVLSTLRFHPTQYLKRVFDFVGALCLLVVFSPIMLAAGIAIFLTSPGPIFFVQQRYGWHRKRFSMYKFRSMVVDAEKRQSSLEAMNDAQGPVFKLKNDPRVTRVGAFLRKTSIDELPQLFNVLRGDMSLVGPRPLTLRDVSLFEETWLLRRFSVRPGLTCLWQVSGRSNTSFDFWIKQDLTYIDGWSFGLDLKILLMTIPAVLKGSGAV